MCEDDGYGIEYRGWELAYTRLENMVHDAIDEMQLGNMEKAYNILLELINPQEQSDNTSHLNVSPHGDGNEQ